MSTWTLKENSCGELKITLNGENWKALQLKAFDKIAKNVEIEGFRKGKAPKALIQKQINEQQILMEAAEMGAQDCLTAGIVEHDLFLVARPDLGIDELNAEGVAYNFTITVKPEVKLNKYTGLTYTMEEVTFTDEEMNAELVKVQENFAELSVKDSEVVNGDTAVIDFEGFKDGVAFDGGQGENFPLEIGSNSFIPGFEEQIIGMKQGDSKDLDVTFPEAYGAEDLAGQAVVFKVSVKEVKGKVLPELNDELAKDTNTDGVETLEDLKNSISAKLLDAKKQTAENNALDNLITELVENSEVEVPAVMVENEVEDMIKEQSQRMQQQGFGFEQFLQMTGQSIESVKEQFKGDATSRIKVRLILEAVAKAENITATEEEIAKEFEAIATTYKMEIEKVKEMIDASNLTYDIEMRKALDFVKASAI